MARRWGKKSWLNPRRAPLRLATQDRKVVDVETLVLQVMGMSCTGCEQRIAMVLSHLDGVLRSSADHATGAVRVVLDPARNSEQAVSDAIEQAGYQVVGHE